MIKTKGKIEYMNLAILGFIMIIIFMVLIMTRKMSALTALIVIPTILL